MANINDNYTFSADTGVISRLDDNPNESDLDAAGLKAAFDAGATNVVNQINNDLIPAINARCDEIATTAGTTATGLGNVNNLTTPVTTDAVSAINSVNTSLNTKTEDSGWEPITPSRGTWSKLRIRKVGKKVYFEGYATAISFNGESAQKKICTIPEGYRLPGTENKYFIVAAAGSSLAKLYLKPSEAESNANDFGFDWIKKMSDAADDKSSQYLSFSIEYFID